jgi:deoxyribonuclease V
LKLEYLHDWPLTKHEAIKIQKNTRPRVNLHGDDMDPGLIAAVDTAYGFGGEYLYVAVAVLSFPNLEEVERGYYKDKVTFPYSPGLFYFREGPMIVEALSRLETDPDLIIVQGHGTAHPHLCGIACHIGVDFAKPSIGCARRLLVGDHLPVGEAKGSHQPIRLRGSEVGMAYRTKDSVKPLFISPGHLCDLQFAVKIVVQCLRGFRLPEPLRVAHLLANKYKRKMEKNSRPKPLA